MGADETGRRKAEDSEAPQAWVWSKYQGMTAQTDREHGDAEEENPMLFEEKALHPFATALGLVLAVAVILGLMWLFTPHPTLG